MFLCFKCVFKDRLTFRRIIVKNNAKKRKMYESFIETLPLLTSLEVRTPVYLFKKLLLTIGLEAFNQSDLVPSTAVREDEGGGRHIVEGVQ